MSDFRSYAKFSIANSSQHIHPSLSCLFEAVAFAKRGNGRSGPSKIRLTSGRHQCARPARSRRTAGAALVFGGGHVLLPLLESAVVAPGWVSPEAFLTGYGGTQAVPGPLFTFSAYLGALVAPAGHPAIGATIALVAEFLPGGLLAYGILPFWRKLSSIRRARAAVHGTNAAVVGILAAPFYDPVSTGAILSPLDLLIAIAGFAALVFGKVPPWVVVVLLASAGGAIGCRL